MKVLIIDNYDSFAYNIYQAVGVITNNEPLVYYNDQITVEQVEKICPDRLIISSGIGDPNKRENTGNSGDIIKAFYKKIPILGISMGNLIVGLTFNCKVKYSPNIFHGELISISHNNEGLFKNIENNMLAMAYYTFVLDESNMPNDFIVTAKSDTHTIMGIKLKKYPVYGLQFNPESIGTENGNKIFKNFLN